MEIGAASNHAVESQGKTSMGLIQNDNATSSDQRCSDQWSCHWKYITVRYGWETERYVASKSPFSFPSSSNTNFSPSCDGMISFMALLMWFSGGATSTVSFGLLLIVANSIKEEVGTSISQATLLLPDRIPLVASNVVVLEHWRWWHCYFGHWVWVLPC